MDLENIEAVIKLMQKYGLQELEVKEKSSQKDHQAKDRDVSKDLGKDLFSESSLRIVQSASFANHSAVANPYPASYLPQPMMSSFVAPQQPQHSPSSQEKTESAKRSSAHEIRSPFVGTFYASGSPGAEPFAQLHQRVKKGDPLCIIEAMKLMNEIEADRDGVIVEILVDNEQPVEYNQVLFLIE